MRHHFTTFDLRISANVKIPGLRPASFEPADADLRIDVGAFPAVLRDVLASPHRPWLADSEHEGLRVSSLQAERYIRFEYDWGVDCVLEPRAGRIWARWHPPRTLDDAALYLVGPVLGFLMRLAGRTCLHASAVEIDRRAVALVGVSGIGKSTLAWALARRGHAVVADDVVLLQDDDTGFQAVPAHGRLRVFPDAVTCFEGAGASRPPLAPAWDKCYVDLVGGSLQVAQAPVPLARVHVLHPIRDSDQTPTLRTIRSTDAVPLLAANTYRTELLNARMRAQEFACLTRLVERVPVARLGYGAGLDRIEAVCERIEGDLREPAS